MTLESMTGVLRKERKIRSQRPRSGHVKMEADGHEPRSHQELEEAEGHPPSLRRGRSPADTFVL